MFLASEGGYQVFELKGGEFAVLALSGLSALLAIAVGFILVKGTLAADQGTPKMIEIATAIQEGALAYLKRQFRTIGIILIPLTIVVFLTSTEVIKPESAGGGVALSFFESGLFRTLAFVAGCLMSGLTGYIGMTLATRGNVRTAAAAKSGSLARALEVAFRTGGIAGMFTVGLGLAGATLIIVIFQNTSSAILVGFGFGGSLLALFLRVGGGIFTKAADVGADLVGKVEAGIPEDDPRNPATIADNVGDNVGDCAGMAADLFESYEVTLVASIILGVAAFESIGANPALGLIFPVAARAIGVIASIFGVYAVKAKEGETNALKPINRGFLTASVLTIIGTGIVALAYVGNDPHLVDGKMVQSNEGWKVFAAVVVGLLLAQLVSRLTEYFTGTEFSPGAGDRRVGPHRPGHDGPVRHGGGARVQRLLGHRHRHRHRCGHRPRRRQPAVLPLPGRPVRHGHAGHHRRHRLRGHLRPGGRQRRRHRRDVGRVPRRAGADHGQPRRRREHHQGRDQGLRHRVGGDRRRGPLRQLHRGGGQGAAGRRPGRGAAPSARGVFDEPPINVADPKIFIGLLIGGAVPFLFSALAIRAVGRSAGVVVQEVRRQFADGKIMAGTKRPDYGPVIDICTAASLRELATPALLAMLTPVIIGFGISWQALGAFLAAVIVTGQLMAVYLSNSGGAWDNAKKYIEDGHEGGKGSEAHKAAVIGDTVGDPFKDTAGPALNPLIKVMNLISLLILPAVIAMEGLDVGGSENGARFAIAVVARHHPDRRRRVLQAEGDRRWTRPPRAGRGHGGGHASAPAAACPMATAP